MTPVLLLLPIWAFIYFGTFGERGGEELTPIQLGERVYNNAGCAGCHGADGQGGVGPALPNGDAVKTFPERGRPHRLGRERLGAARRASRTATRTARAASESPRRAPCRGSAARSRPKRSPPSSSTSERACSPVTDRPDVLVVGGGPAGASCAYWLAEAGHEVVLVERKTFPREKTCGDGLTPRAVKQLEEIGLGDQLAGHHRFGGLRSIAFGRTLELEWPETPDFPRYGYVVTRHDLDAMVAERAEKAGAAVWQGTEAVEPLVENGLVTGAVLKRKESGDTQEVRARYVVVADGANSRFGRALGTSRDRGYPQGMAIRGYFTSPRHDEPWIESHLDIRDAEGACLPGYGWIFPLGDGRVNVGIGLLSTFSHWKAVNTTKLMESFVVLRPQELGHLARDRVRAAHRWPPAHGVVGAAPCRTHLSRRRRRRRRHQPVQRRGHRLRLRDRAVRGRGARSGARHQRWAGAAHVRAAADRPSTTSTTAWLVPSSASSVTPS